MKIEPMAWKDKPALIEVAFPAQKISIEAQCERKANAGQTLTALGSYWKGRKPLVLVRACVLGALLPSTGDTEKDLEIFEMLMAMDDDAFVHRIKSVSVKDVEQWAGPLRDEILDGNGKWKVRGEEKQRLLARVLIRMSYDKRLHKRSLRPEELPATAYEAVWDRVNEHLGTTARSHVDLVKELGILRFGHRPRVGDAFCGAGSIPFEAARLGCDVHASDLNPIACMLTWGAFHVIGAADATRAAMCDAQVRVADAVEETIVRLEIEQDDAGNRAKAYLYCVETTCPETGWSIPLAPSWVISRNQRVAAQLVPDPIRKRLDVRLIQNATDEQLEEAKCGTVQGPGMVYVLDGIEHRTSLKTIRGERKLGGKTINELRQWERADFVPRPNDIFRERLYCIQWIDVNDPRRAFFCAPTAADMIRERTVEETVRTSLARWQVEGIVSDMAIADGKENEGPIRTRGWTHWHHLFTPRSLLILALYTMAMRDHAKDPIVAGTLAFHITSLADRSSRLSRWEVGFPGRPGVAPSADAVKPAFYSQALHTFYNYGARSFYHLRQSLKVDKFARAPIHHALDVTVRPAPVAAVTDKADIFVTDPPYADAVSYEEITEYFIAWLRNKPPAPFSDWIWDSRRELAIRGSGDDFRHEMVRAYTALAAHMPDNGMQVVMFTHQDARVWGDMAGIFWAAGLRVTAAWYIATETTSELKKGGYVQGTVILVLRKRTEPKKAYKDELVLEIREEVKRQLDTMTGLNQRVRARGRSENLFEDVDLQMAGYAAALRVLTGYTDIDGIDMTREALRPKTEGERSIVDVLIDFAVALANEELVPEGLEPKVWEKLIGAERFCLRMLDLEAAGHKKLDNYQNFAKAFRVGDWQPLMATMKPNNSRLKSAREFKRAEFGTSEFGSSLLRAVLYALHELEAEVETDEVMSHLRDNVQGYYARRAEIVAIADYLAGKLDRVREAEAAAARVLRDLVKGERLGA